MHNKYTTVRELLHLIDWLAQSEPLNFETQDIISKHVHEALNEIDVLEGAQMQEKEARPLTLEVVEDEHPEAAL